MTFRFKTHRIVLFIIQFDGFDESQRMNSMAWIHPGTAEHCAHDFSRGRPGNVSNPFHLSGRKR